MIRLALIGLGKWGINFLKSIEKTKDCEIKYIVAETEATLSQFPNSYIKATNYQDLLKYSDIDGIIIATPGSTHFVIAKIFIPKGIPLLIEKPLTLNYKEALLLKKLAIKNPSSIMVGHIYLYNPAYIKMKQLIKEIGKIRYLSFKGYNYGPFRDDMSVLWEWGPHGIAMSIDLFNKMPRSVTAWGINTLRRETTLYDTVFIRLLFDNNSTCLLECGWLYPLKRREMIIYGSTSSLIFDDLIDKKIKFFEHLGPTVNGKIIKEEQPIISYPTYETGASLDLELEEFIKIIKENKKPKTDLDHAINVIKIIAAAEKSLKQNGKQININYEKKN